MPFWRRFGVPTLIAITAAVASTACGSCGDDGGHGDDAGSDDAGQNADAEAGADTSTTDGGSGADASPDADADSATDATTHDAPSDAPVVDAPFDAPVVDGSDDCGTQCGTVEVDARLDMCPKIESYLVSPLTAAVGQDVQLDVTATDADGDPITYTWSATSGTIAAPHDATTTFHCSIADTPTLTIAISDGICGDESSVPVTCTP
jgi:chitinase